MEELLGQIKETEFKTMANFSYSLDSEREIISAYLDENQVKLLEHDFDTFLSYGKSLVLNSFTGHLLFLKTPEQVDKLEIEYHSDQYVIIARSMFLSDAKDTETVTWKMEGIFPNFHSYPITVKTALMIVIGKIVKRICEYGKANWAYMNIMNPFMIHLIINGTPVAQLDVEID